MGRGGCATDTKKGESPIDAARNSVRKLSQAPTKAMNKVSKDMSVMRHVLLAQKVERALRSAKKNGKTEQRKEEEERLGEFYETQVEEYEQLKLAVQHGRDRLIAALAERLHGQRNLVWVDMGSGTADSVEKMSELMGGLDAFAAIYVIEQNSLKCAAAMKKCKENNYKNVVVVHGDCANFVLPENLTASVVTFSYSLSKCKDYFKWIDQAFKMLGHNGFLGVSDFFVSAKEDQPNRQMSGMGRWFWRAAFDLGSGGRDIGPERRQFLEHHLTTVLEYNGRGSIPYVPLLKAPYYVWIGRKCTEDDDDGEYSLPVVRTKGAKAEKPPWWQFFPPTYLYSVSWEDPAADEEHLSIRSEDRVLTLCAGGCNTFDYLLAGARQVVAVDMNPAQNHLLELKAVATARLPYEDAWLMFGEGKHPNIKDLFHTKLAPFLSQDAVDFWSVRLHDFKRGLYYSGGMGLLVSLIRILTIISFSQSAMKRLLEAPTIEEQAKVWNSFTIVRMYKSTHKWIWKVFGFLTSIFFLNDLVLWYGAGVPKNQLNLITKEQKTPIQTYVMRLLDGVAEKSHVRDENYFYHVCLAGRFNRGNCPAYLNQDNFETLKDGRISNLKITTNTFVEELKKGLYSKVILMDHVDWLPRPLVEELSRELAAHVVKNGRILWRSASVSPPYVEDFRKAGFKVQRIHCHSEDCHYIDRVNMYASFWIGIKQSNPSFVESDDNEDEATCKILNVKNIGSFAHLGDIVADDE
mmetsp:Transcript_8248/g.30422  ORF Transcript_8248/g.30422 Transcript_8248/m.30422 type:complete len:746 (-) Transcript_8248:1595-3832(-)|eukprot:scaffold603_cov404-Prasinococcus_capsulatus_cf.AAC.13